MEIEWESGRVGEREKKIPPHPFAPSPSLPLPIKTLNRTSTSIVFFILKEN